MDKTAQAQPEKPAQQGQVDLGDIAQREAAKAKVLPRKAIHRPVAGPGNLPVPEAPPAEQAPSEAPPRKGAEPRPEATTQASFAALSDNDTRIPPDTNGAAGPNHLMVALNSEILIQDKRGNVLSRVSLDSFWTTLGSQSTFDPRIVYDANDRRWYFAVGADARQTTSAVLIGVSLTDDPTGSWNLYKYTVDPTKLLWADFPTLGFNKTWICLQVNMFPITSGSGTFRSQVYAFPKANLFNGNGNCSVFNSTFMESIGSTQVPAVTFDPAEPTQYLLQDWNGNSGGNGFLRLYQITGAVGAETLAPVAFVSAAAPWDSQGPLAPQLGSAQRIDTGDSRMQNVLLRNGSLWAAHAVFLPAGGSASRSSVQWWQITTAGGVRQRGRVDDSSGVTFFAFPSIAVNRNNDALVGYSRFSASQFASASYSFRASGDPANTLRADTLIKAGEASYFKTFSDTENRWGDYSASTVDPTNDTDFWTIQEFAGTPSGDDRWGTWWARIG
jgi:hypothetical protein